MTTAKQAMTIIRDKFVESYRRVGGVETILAMSDVEFKATFLKDVVDFVTFQEMYYPQ